MFLCWYWHIKRGCDDKNGGTAFFCPGTALWQLFKSCHSALATNQHLQVLVCAIAMPTLLTQTNGMSSIVDMRETWLNGILDIEPLGIMKTGFFTIKFSILRWKTRFHDPKGFYVQKYLSIRSLLCLQYWTYHLFVSKGFAQQWHSLKLVNPDATKHQDLGRIYKF